MYSGHVVLWYKLPKTDLKKGLFELDSDEKILIMYSIMSACKYFEIYAFFICAVSQVSPDRGPKLNDIEFDNRETHETHEIDANANNSEDPHLNDIYLRIWRFTKVMLMQTTLKSLLMKFMWK